MYQRVDNRWLATFMERSCPLRPACEVHSSAHHNPTPLLMPRPPGLHSGTPWMAAPHHTGLGQAQRRGKAEDSTVGSSLLSAFGFRGRKSWGGADGDGETGDGNDARFQLSAL